MKARLASVACALALLVGAAGPAAAQTSVSDVLGR